MLALQHGFFFVHFAVALLKNIEFRSHRFANKLCTELGSGASLYVSVGTLDLGMRPALQRAACSIPPYPI